jgi:hypothetical protein
MIAAGSLRLLYRGLVLPAVRRDQPWPAGSGPPWCRARVVPGAPGARIVQTDILLPPLHCANARPSAVLSSDSEQPSGRYDETGTRL